MSIQEAHISELQTQNAQLLAELEAAKKNLDGWPAHAAEHARKVRAAERVECLRGARAIVRQLVEESRPHCAGMPAWEKANNFLNQ